MQFIGGLKMECEAAMVTAEPGDRSTRIAHPDCTQGNTAGGRKMGLLVIAVQST